MLGLGKVLSFIKGLDLRVILLVLVFFLSGFAYWQIVQKNNYKDQVQIQSNNIAALQDSAREYKTRNGELGKEKLALQTTVKDLEIANEDLAKELKKERGNVKTIIKTETVVEHDTVYVDSSRVSTIGMNRYRVDWFYSDEGEGWSRNLEGYTAFDYLSTEDEPFNIETVITRDDLNLSIVTGIREENGVKTIFVRSNYPNIDFVEINGAVIDDSPLSNPKRWGIGPSLGYGVTQKGDTAVFFGLTVNYNIIRW